MKTKSIIFFLLLFVNFGGFSQQQIVLPPGEKFKKEIHLSPDNGYGKGRAIILDATLLWDSNKNTIEVTFYGSKSFSGSYIYLFEKPLYFDKVGIPFKRAIKKKIKKEGETVRRSVDIDNLLNLTFEKTDPNINGFVSLNEERKEPMITFTFKVKNTKEECRIPMNIYVASEKRNLFGKRRKKMQYMSRETLSFTLKDICEDPNPKTYIRQIERLIDEREQTRNVLLNKNKDFLSTLSCDELKKEKANLKEEYPDPERERLNLNKEVEPYRECFKETHQKYIDITKSCNKNIREYNSDLGAEIKRRGTKCDPPPRVDCPKHCENKIVNAKTEQFVLLADVEKNRTATAKDLSSLKDRNNKIIENLAGCKLCTEYNDIKKERERIEDKIKK